MRRGRPPTWMRIGIWNNGDATTLRLSGAHPVSPSWERQRRCSVAWPGRISLLDLDTRLPNDLSITLCISPDALGECCGRHVLRSGAESLHALSNCLVLQRLPHRLVEPRYDRARRAGGSEQALPAQHIDRESAFDECRPA